MRKNSGLVVINQRNLSDGIMENPATVVTKSGTLLATCGEPDNVSYATGVA